MTALHCGPIELKQPVRIVGAVGDFEGPNRLTLSGPLARGRYRLSIRVREAVHNQLLAVRLNGHIIDTFGVPFAGDPDDNWVGSRRDRVRGDKEAFVNGVKQRYGVNERYRRQLAERDAWTFDSDFVVDRPGEQQIVLSNENEDDSGAAVRFYHGDGIEILSIALEPHQAEAPNTFRRRLGGLPALDAWGWMAYLDFDNPGGREATFDEILTSAVIEARRAGANLLELNPSLRDGHCFDFESDGGPVEGTVKSTRTAWTTDRLRRLFRLAHEHGMLVELFIFSIVGFHSFYDMSAEQIMTFLERVHKLLGCRDSREATLAAIDGAIYELYPHDAPRETDQAWQHNPGVVQAVSGGITGTAMELSGMGYSAGFANYTAHWVGSPVQHTGYDAVFSAAPYPADFYRRPGQSGTGYLQGSAERYRPAEGNMVRSGYMAQGFPGRDAAPDWIVAQLQGFARRRWRDEDDPAASVVGWEAVADEIAPPAVRRIVQAATQDPIRAVVTGSLEDTGRGGTIDFRRMVRRKDPSRRLRLEPRHAFPDNSRFVRNQDLELLTFPGKDYNVLNLDLSRSAQFYANGRLVRPFQPFWVTLSADAGMMSVEESQRVTRVGGALGEIEQRFVFTRSDCTIGETRRLRVLTDRPGLELTVHRRVDGRADGATVTVPQGCAPHPAYTIERVEHTPHRLLLRLVDPDGVLPEAMLRILVEEAAVEDPVTDDDVRFNTTIAQSATVRVRAAFACGHMTPDTLAELIDDDAAWRVPLIELPPDGREVSVPGHTSFDDTRVVAVTPSVDGPCRVREDGWWHYRGITPDDEHPSRDLLKLHRRKDDTVRIARDSLIGGHATWGWGSQYIMVLSDIREANGEFLVDVQVDRVTPFVFAPRVRLRETPSALTLNGRPWHYADGPVVFLPNRPGRYTLGFRYGRVDTPRIARSMAVIEETGWDGSILTLRAALPPWCSEAPEHHGWTALIDDGRQRRVHPITIGTTEIPFARNQHA